MPKARYQKEASTGYYYISVPNGKLRKDGYPQYKKLRAKTQAELDEKLEAFKQLTVLDVQPDKTTLDEWYNIWFSKYKSTCERSTQEFYKNLYNKHIKPAIGNIQLVKLKELHGQQILSDLSKTHAQKTIKSVRSVLYSLGKTAQANKLISYNPFENLTAKGKAAKQRRALTLTERSQYLAAIDSSTAGTFAAFLYFFGLRRGEALALKGSDIKGDKLIISKEVSYPDNNHPVIKTTKTENGIREIPIPQKAYNYINFDNLPKGFIFTTDNNELLPYATQERMWKNFIKEAFPEGTDITRHYLRHNYCTMLFEAGIDLLTVKTVAGHADIQTTMQIYTHYTESLKTTAQNKFANIG